ncbi:MAG: hypothetical protein WCY61_02510 [Sphaerochaeta sp.]
MGLLATTGVDNILKSIGDVSTFRNFNDEDWLSPILNFFNSYVWPRRDVPQEELEGGSVNPEITPTGDTPYRINPPFVFKNPHASIPIRSRV